MTSFMKRLLPILTISLLSCLHAPATIYTFPLAGAGNKDLLGAQFLPGDTLTTYMTCTGQTPCSEQGDQAFLWSNPCGGFNQYVYTIDDFDNPVWLPSDPVLQLGTAFFYTKAPTSIYNQIER